MLKYVKEEFFLYLMASMYLIKRIEFMKIIESELAIDIDNPDDLGDYNFTDNFYGNFWRISAMFKY